MIMTREPFKTTVIGIVVLGVVSSLTAAVIWNKWKDIAQPEPIKNPPVETTSEPSSPGGSQNAPAPRTADTQEAPPREGNGEPNPNAQALQPEAPIEETYQKTFADDFLIELHSCVLRGKNLICNFSVTNDLDSDREFFLRIYWGNASRVFDEDGNEYMSQRGQIGKQSGTPGISGYGEPLISEVKTKASLEFEGIAPNVKVAKLLRIVFSGDGYHEQTADFRDIPMQIR